VIFKVEDWGPFILPRKLLLRDGRTSRKEVNKHKTVDGYPIKMNVESMI
jgi:hypothetical protein